jgi:adenosylhomocysteine nucleosidase
MAPGIIPRWDGSPIRPGLVGLRGEGRAEGERAARDMMPGEAHLPSATRVTRRRVPGRPTHDFASQAVDLRHAAPPAAGPQVVVLVCATSEWRALDKLLPEPPRRRSPFGDWFAMPETTAGPATAFVYGGWGKIAAAASTQYAIDRFAPQLLVNLGTCGGLTGEVERGEVLLAERTLVYDIVEQMTDADEAIAERATTIDLSWLDGPEGEPPAAYPSPVRRVRLVSADSDIVPSQIGRLREKYGAVAADWESGAIAWTAARNSMPCLILRAVSDLVDPAGGEVYDDYAEFERRSLEIMRALLAVLPAWLTAWSHRPAGWSPRQTP